MSLSPFCKRFSLHVGVGQSVFVAAMKLYLHVFFMKYKVHRSVFQGVQNNGKPTLAYILKSLLHFLKQPPCNVSIPILQKILITRVLHEV